MKKIFELYIDKIRKGTITETEINSLENGLNQCFNRIEELEDIIQKMKNEEQIRIDEEAGIDI